MSTLVATGRLPSRSLGIYRNPSFSFRKSAINSTSGFAGTPFVLFGGVAASWLLNSIVIKLFPLLVASVIHPSNQLVAFSAVDVKYPSS